MEPAPDALATVDLRPTPRVPSPHELVGVVVALVPFVITVAVVSSRSDGTTTSFVYRDWLAVACGGAAIVCGVLSAVMLRRTDRSKRLARAGVMVALLGVGALQILRGFGVGIAPPEASGFMRTTHVEVLHEPATTIPAVAVDELARGFFAAWRDGRVREIHDAAHPDLREATTIATLEDVRALYADAFGKLERLGALKDSYADATFTVTGTLVHAKGALDLELQYKLVDGKPLLSHASIQVPEALRFHPDPADADRVARRLLDGLLAGRFDKQVLHPDLIANMTDDLAPLENVLAKLGKVKSISPPRPRDCAARRCLDFTVVGSKRKATYAVELAFQLHRWRVDKFDLTVDDRP